MALEHLERVQFEHRAQCRAWLERHHATSPGVWVVTFKKAARKPSPSYDEIVLEALCFGWIDSKPGKVDDERSKLYVCPRKRGSVRAATNKARVEVLLVAGLMTPAGRAQTAHLLGREREDRGHPRASRGRDRPPRAAERARQPVAPEDLTPTVGARPAEPQWTS